MKAIVCPRYGSPDVLQFTEVAKPVPQDQQLLIKVYAASVNTADLAMSGHPLARLLTGGLLRPKDPRVGIDLAGRVEAVGRAITAFQPGDAVFGRARGAFAEYVCAREEAVVLKPPALTFEAT